MNEQVLNNLFERLNQIEVALLDLKFQTQELRASIGKTFNPPKNQSEIAYYLENPGTWGTSTRGDTAHTGEPKEF